MPRTMHPEPTMEARLDLALRYAELGLPAAAAGLLEELCALPSVAPAALVALAELRSLAGAAEQALELAERACALEGSAAQQLLVAELALALDAPQRAAEALAAVETSAPLDGELSARALLATAALRRRQDAWPQVQEALLSLVERLDVLPEARFEELVALARAADAVVLLRDRLREDRRPAALLVDGLLLEASGGTDAEIETALRAAFPFPPARLALAYRLARRRGRDAAARVGALEQLETLRSTLPVGQARARVELLLASLHDDDLAAAELAVDGYQRALPLLPRDGTACNNLGVIALRGGDLAQAEHWFVRALIADPLHETAQRNLARLLYAATSPRQLEAALANVRSAGLDTRALAHLCFALVEVARDDAHHGIAAKGHQLKNLLGVLGARLRGLARREGGATKEQLAGLAERLAAVYDEWAAYLRTLQHDTVQRSEVAAADAVDLNALASEAARQVGGRVRLRLADELPEVQGLRGQLREALVNLLRNAAEASSESEDVELVVHTEVVSEGRAVCVSVIDHGSGIALGELRRVLQAGYTTKREGSGLGLSLCQRVAQAHGGRIEIESTPGQGTTVRLLLPVHWSIQTRHGMLQTPLARILRAAAAEEYVIED